GSGGSRSAAPRIVPYSVRSRKVRMFMRPLLPHLWPGACLLIALASGGCQNCRQCCSTCTAPPAATKGVPVAARTNWAPAASAPVKHVSTYPPLPPAVSTANKPTPSSTTDYQQSAVPPADLSITNALAEIGPSSSASSTKEPMTTETVSSEDGSRYGHDPN